MTAVDLQIRPGEPRPAGEPRVGRGRPEPVAPDPIDAMPIAAPTADLPDGDFAGISTQRHQTLKNRPSYDDDSHIGAMAR